MFSFVGIAHILDVHLLGNLFGDAHALRTIVCLFYIGNEGLSIIENADELGVPFPKPLKDKFLDFKANAKEKSKSKSEHKPKAKSNGKGLRVRKTKDDDDKTATETEDIEAGTE